MKHISLPSNPSADESCVERFLKAIRSGPVYFFVASNRCLCKSNFVLFDNEKFYICKTCQIQMKKTQVPCQAVYKLFVDDIPEETSCLNKSELFLISKWFLFKK